MKKLFFILILTCFAVFSYSGTVIVTNINNSGVGSLRAAVALASSGDTIRFSSSLISGGNDTILLNSRISSSSKMLIIIGLYNSTDTLFISGRNSYQIFSIDVTNITSKKFVLDSVCLINASTYNNGGAVLFKGEEIIVKNSLFKNCKSTKKGGAIYAESFSYTYSLPITLKVFNSKIIRNSANTDGGAVFIKSNKKAKVKINNSEISYNSSGVTCYSEDSSSVMIIENSTFFKNNKLACVSRNGYSTDSSYLYIKNCNIDSNEFGVSSENIIMSNTIISNTTRIGISGYSLEIDSSQINNSNNGIYVSDNGKLILKNSKLYNNTGYHNNLGGGGIWAYGGSRILIYNCEIYNNQANNYGDKGGGILLDVSNSQKKHISLTIVDSKIYNNSSYKEGGGIYLNAKTSNILIDNSIISKNLAGLGGAGIYLNSQRNKFNLINSIIDSNISSTGNGGGILSYISLNFDSAFSKMIITNSKVINNVGKNGGGININTGNTTYPNHYSEITLKNSIIKNNSASNSGGGIYSEGMSYSRIKCENSNFINNKAISLNGGGIYSISGDSTSSISIIHSLFDSNTCSNSGGGVYSSGFYKSFVNCQGSSFTNNKSLRYGGGIYSNGDSSSNVNVSSSTFFQNSTIQKGGGVFSKSLLYKSIVDFNNTTLYNNESIINGSAIHSDGRYTAYGHINLVSSVIVNDSNTNTFYCGTFYSNGYNFSTDTGFFGRTSITNHVSDSFNMDSSSLLLGTLQNNGGNSLSMIPDSASVLFNAGNPLDFSNAQNWAVTDSRRDAGATENTCFNTVNDTIVRCNSYISPSGNHVWNLSGLYYDTIFLATRCDSLILINLTINATRSNISPAICSHYLSPSGNIYSISGLYNDTLINYVGCDSIISINLTLNKPDTSVSLINPTTLSANDSVSKYQWLDCNASLSILTNDTNRLYNPYSSGLYAVELTKNGCKDTSSCYSLLGYGVGIEKKQISSKTSLFPNPNKGTFTLQLEKEVTINSIFITDLNGRIIKKITPQKTATYEINFEGASGIYFLNVVTENKRTVLKLIKE